MIKIENVDVFGWEAAIRGMRNPMNSWDRSDTRYYAIGTPVIGENDLKLMRTLGKAGAVHGKYLRMINVTCDITAPLYWWKEFDTYKVCTVSNSCSTMHKIHEKEFTLDDFSCEHFNEESKIMLENVINFLNISRDCYNSIKRKRIMSQEDVMLEKSYWWQMIQLLPSSYNQKRTVQLNYEVLRGMYEYRKNHKLDEWVEFCKWIERLPYFKEILLDE